MATRAQSKAERELGITLGKRIAALRKERGFTQVELAKKLDVSQAIISSYEIGRVRPHPDVLIKLAELLEVSTDEILGRGSQLKQKTQRLDRRFVRRLQAVGQLPKPGCAIADN